MDETLHCSSKISRVVIGIQVALKFTAKEHHKACLIIGRARPSGSLRTGGLEIFLFDGTLLLEEPRCMGALGRCATARRFKSICGIAPLRACRSLLLPLRLLPQQLQPRGHCLPLPKNRLLLPQPSGASRQACLPSSRQPLGNHHRRPPLHDETCSITSRPTSRAQCACSSSPRAT